MVPFIRLLVIVAELEVCRNALAPFLETVLEKRKHFLSIIRPQ